MSTAAAHLADWEARGLIDHETAERLRAAPDDVPPAVPASVDRPGAAGTWFGPGVTIAEVFAYLGAGFLLAAFNWVVADAASGDAASGQDADIVFAVGWLIGAVVVVVIGLAMRARDARGSRAAGVLFLTATGFAAGSAAAFAQTQSMGWPAIGIAAGLAASILAIVLRRVHPAVLTQVGLLWALTGTAAAVITWVEASFFRDDSTGGTNLTGPDPLVLVIGSAVWWLAVAVGLALIGLRESRIAVVRSDAAAGRRAAVSRFWAGFVAVVGLATAVSMSHFDPATGESRRILEPWIGDVALLVLSAVLVERAFRRDATSFIYAAALGLIVALTDFNLAYLSENTGGALLVEGLILLGVGVLADRLRRRIGAAPTSAGQPVIEAPTAESVAAVSPPT